MYVKKIGSSYKKEVEIDRLESVIGKGGSYTGKGRTTHFGTSLGCPFYYRRQSSVETANLGRRSRNVPTTYSLYSLPALGTTSNSPTSQLLLYLPVQPNLLLSNIPSTFFLSLHFPKGVHFLSTSSFLPENKIIITNKNRTKQENH